MLSFTKFTLEKCIIELQKIAIKSLIQDRVYFESQWRGDRGRQISVRCEASLVYIVGPDLKNNVFIMFESSSQFCVRLYS